MKPIMEITHILTSFVYQKASLLSSVTFLIAMPIRSVSKETEVQEQVLEPEQTLNKRKPGSRNRIVSVAGLASCLVLSGCTGSTYSSHFDCPMGEGAGCASISRVNKMIDRREIDLNGDDLSTGDGTPVTRTPANQVYVYYGPNHLSRLVPTDSIEGN